MAQIRGASALCLPSQGGIRYPMAFVGTAGPATNRSFPNAGQRGIVGRLGQAPFQTAPDPAALQPGNPRCRECASTKLVEVSPKSCPQGPTFALARGPIWI